MVKWIFGLLVLMAAALIAAAVGTVPDMVAGGPHSEYAGMSIGGDGAARLEGLWIQGLVVYFASFVIMPLFCVMGVAERNRTKKFWTMMLSVMAVNVLFAALLIYFYVDFLSSGSTFLLLGFPAPTAMMLFGCWGSAALYTAIFIVGFDEFIFTPEDEQKLEELVRGIKKDAAGE